MMVSAFVSPFHDNTETPAAKLYHDSNGDTLWCFSEQRRYKPTDVIHRNMIPRVSIDKVFINIWKQLSEDDQKSMIEDYGKPVSFLPENWEENKKLLQPFKSGEMNFIQYLVVLKAIM